MKKSRLLFFGMIFLQLFRNILAMEALSPEAIPYLNYEMARDYFALQNHKQFFAVALDMSHHEQEWRMVSDKIDLLLQSNMLYFVDGDLEKNFTHQNSGKGGYSDLEEILAATLLLRGVIFSESGLREERPLEAREEEYVGGMGGVTVRQVVHEENNNDEENRSIGSNVVELGSEASHNTPATEITEATTIPSQQTDQEMNTLV